MTTTIVSRVDENSFDFGNAVDALTAYVTKNSLAHLIRESTQVRINWAGGTAAGHSTLVGGAIVTIYPYVYPHTWLSSTQLANIDLYVACRVSGGSGESITLTARIVPNSYPLGSLSAPSIFGADITGTTSSTTADYVIDEQHIVPQIAAPFFSKSFDSTYGAETEDGVGSFAVQSLMRLELSIDTNDDIPEICAVYLREYAS